MQKLFQLFEVPILYCGENEFDIVSNSGDYKIINRGNFYSNYENDMFFEASKMEKDFFDSENRRYCVQGSIHIIKRSTGWHSYFFRI